MAKARPSITKRLREKSLMEKRMRKAEKKADRDFEKEGREEVEGDPDLAGIVAGPQRPIHLDWTPEGQAELDGDE
jgi:hypothetical protein